MKKSIIYSATVVALILSACNNSSKKVEQTNSTDSSKVQTVKTTAFDTTTLKAGDAFYQCPMHAEVLSNKMDKCPKCEMDLLEMKRK
jgi:predicted nucleic acid binding AN1-type Zn finger protein